MKISNAQFEELSSEEKVEYFKQFTQTDIDSLTQLQAAEYEKFLHPEEPVVAVEASVTEEVAEAKPETPEEAAARFFGENPDYDLDTVYVAPDATVFRGDLKGHNTASNYCGVKNVLTFSKQ